MTDRQTCYSFIIPCVKFPFPCRHATDMLWWSTSTIWNSKCIKHQNIRVRHAFYTVMRCLVTCYITGEKQFSVTAVKSSMTHWQHFMDVGSCIKYDGKVGWMNWTIGVYMISCIFLSTFDLIFFTLTRNLENKFKVWADLPIGDTNFLCIHYRHRKRHFSNIFHYPYNNSANKWQLNEEKNCAEDPDKYSVVRKISCIQPFMFDGKYNSIFTTSNMPISSSK